MHDRDRRAEQTNALVPYLTVLAVGIVIGLAVLAYAALHRAEIIAILTQSPT
jgi:hypothetical protein